MACNAYPTGYTIRDRSPPRHEEKQNVSSVSIDTAACDRSPACPAKRVCPRNAIVAVPGGVYPGANGYTVRDELCVGCGICARVCPGGAVNLG
ncbi:MAG: hypothetical protein CVT59_07150 [Actinobacteria bacterium HGW-Actinobacteria-1]|nr:MAG: hypothetical protein CVT59_07150 [Actinobacteria bacterium HGW-Actinobacteria-1]